MLYQPQTQIHQPHAKQCVFHTLRALALVDNPQFPRFQQCGVRQRHRPERRQKQQAAQMDVLPQPGQLIGEQAVSLLHGVLTDQLYLTQRHRNIPCIDAG